jgi:hypothetical protein
MGTINAIKLTITSHLFNQSIGSLGNRIKKIPPTLIYNLNDRTVSLPLKQKIGKETDVILIYGECRKNAVADADGRHFLQ